MALLDIFGALRSATNTISAIDKKLRKLHEEQAALEVAPPHIDDVKAWVLRGLDTASQDFLGRLKRWHFNDDVLKAWSGVTLDSHAGAQVLGLSSLSPNFVTPAPVGNFADIMAVTHFLRPAIERELPALVEQCFPGAKNGTRSSERRAKLAAIDTKIAALEAEREQLVAGIRQAQKAIDAPAGAIDDAAAEQRAAEAADSIVRKVNGEVVS